MANVTQYELKLNMSDGSILNAGTFEVQDGKSAHEYAQDGGYTGTEEEFAAKLATVGVGDTIHYIVGNSTTEGVWTGTCSDITEYYDGLTVAYKTNIAGISGGTTLNINGLGDISVRRNASTAVTTTYPVGSVLLLTYSTTDGVGYWLTADYDANTKNTTGTSNKTATKLFLAGATSQASSATTYSNKNCYIGTDNCLYSDGEKVAKASEIPTTLKNPNALTINGMTYDGFEAVNVETGGVVVTAYGATGDGATDDTTAFTNALAENRKVYVPSGTYKLTSGLVIRDNCELEFAQDAVLVFTQTTGNCITLNMSSSIKGNHATVKVPYEFSGNVIYASTTTTESTTDMLPFTRWDPQWKTGRYVTDLNICKADSRGFHYSVNGECNGTAVYVSADGDATSTFMWGIHYSGLRIAGAFSYGIRAENFNDGWNHEMRIDAFIDGCEIGVSLENCNNAYISAIVQPRRAYSLDEVYSAYAKHGIELIDSRNTDLSGSRVWDWNDTNTLWTNGGEYQHIALKGNCAGTILNDFLYYEQSAIDIRDLIYTDTESNLEKITILQEPFTRWFKPIDGVPYFSDGFSEKRLATEEDLAAHFDTAMVKAYTDVLETAIDYDGSIFKGVGYGHGYVEANGEYVDGSQYQISTGFIPVKRGQTIYTEGMTLDTGSDMARIVLYDKDFNYLLHVNRGNLLVGTNYHVKYTRLANGISLKIDSDSAYDGIAYARITFEATSVSDNPLIAIDEEIKYTYEGFLADGIKVKAENLMYMDGYEQTDRMTTTISSSSTDEQYPSAKAVYTALQSALGEYVTDIASLVGGDA